MLAHITPLPNTTILLLPLFAMLGVLCLALGVGNEWINWELWVSEKERERQNHYLFSKMCMNYITVKLKCSQLTVMMRNFFSHVQSTQGDSEKKGYKWGRNSHSFLCNFIRIVMKVYKKNKSRVLAGGWNDEMNRRIYFQFFKERILCWSC